MPESKLDRSTEPTLGFEPIEIKFKRWRSKEHGYLVEVVEVLNYRGKHGVITRVVVERKGMTRRNSWLGWTFLNAFTPVGRRTRRKSRWERIRKA